MKDVTDKRLTVVIPIRHFVKIKAYSADQNITMKEFMTRMICRELIKHEKIYK